MGSALDVVSQSRKKGRSMSFGRFLGFLSLPLAVSGVVLADGACSSGISASATACNLNPFECPSGTTCDLSACTCTTPNCTNENCTPQFACLPSVASAVAGTPCTAELGKATCADGLTCVVEMHTGVCTAYCDSNQPCGTGLECQAKTVELGPKGSYPVVQVCQQPGFDGSVFVPETGAPPPPTDAGKIKDAGHFDVQIPADGFQKK
jgi:hypothetical protein